MSSFAASAFSDPWKFLVIGFGGAVLAIAVWGAFHSDGHYDRQPVAGKWALTAVLTVGGLVLTLAAVTLVSISMLAPNDSFFWSDYVMTREGAIYRLVQAARKPAQIIDLSGAPMIDPKTGRPMVWNEVSQQFAPKYELSLNRAERNPLLPSR